MEEQLKHSAMTDKIIKFPFDNILKARYTQEVFL